MQTIIIVLCCILRKNSSHFTIPINHEQFNLLDGGKTTIQDTNTWHAYNAIQKNMLKGNYNVF